MSQLVTNPARTGSQGLPLQPAGLSRFIRSIGTQLRQPRPLPALHSTPAADYLDAVARTQILQSKDGPEIKTLCRTQLLTHGLQQACAVVLLHGYSSSPHQYHILARQLFERGHNVLIPRYPYHGWQSRTPADFWRMPLEEVVETVNESLDIAQGLGMRVVVLGLSFGGALAAWLAQFRVDIDHAIIVSPALGFRSVPHWRRGPAAFISKVLPPIHTWWDKERKAEGGVQHAYAGWNMRGAAEMMRLGILLDEQSRRAPPAAKNVTVVLNPADMLLDLGPIFDLASQWQRHKSTVALQLFPEAWNLRHDLIEPEAERAQIERVYPPLIELVDREFGLADDNRNVDGVVTF